MFSFILINCVHFKLHYCCYLFVYFIVVSDRFPSSTNVFFNQLHNYLLIINVFKSMFSFIEIVFTQTLLIDFNHQLHNIFSSSMFSNQCFHLSILNCRFWFSNIIYNHRLLIAIFCLLPSFTCRNRLPIAGICLSS